MLFRSGCVGGRSLRVGRNCATTKMEVLAVPDRPGPPVVASVTHHSVDLKWEAPSHDLEGGKLRYCVQEEGESSKGFANVYNGFALRHVVTGLDAHSVYTYRLRASNDAGGSAWSPVVKVTTTGQPVTSLTLHKVLEQGSLADVKAILEDEPHLLEVPDQHGFSPLMVTCHHGNLDLVDFLLHAGTNVEFQNANGHTSLMEACYRGHLSVVKRLKEGGAAWDVKDNAGHTALTWAVDGGHAELVGYILKDGFPVDMEDGSHWTPLHRVAALRGNAKVAKALIDAGADVNRRDSSQTTVLMQAALNGHKDLVKLLLKRGANPQDKNQYGKTAVDFAKAFAREEVVEVLEQAITKHR